MRSLTLELAATDAARGRWVAATVTPVRVARPAARLAYADHCRKGQLCLCLGRIWPKCGLCCGGGIGMGALGTGPG